MQVKTFTSPWSKGYLHMLDVGVATHIGAIKAAILETLPTIINGSLNKETYDTLYKHFTYLDTLEFYACLEELLDDGFISIEE